MARFNSIIINPDLDSRAQLKQAAMSVHDFGHVLMAGTYAQAQGQFEGTESVDVVFISARLPREAIAQAIKLGKQSKQGQFSAYITIYKGKADALSGLSSDMLIGADNVLSEPYSVDDLIEITHLATRVRKERQETKIKMALTLKAKDIMRQLDLVATLKTSGCDPAGSFRSLISICTEFRNATKEMPAEVVEDVLIQTFIDAPIPQRTFQRAYGGVSKRIRQKVEQKIKKELEPLVAAATIPSPEKKV